MSLKLIRVCDTCRAEHEQEDVYPDTRLREYMGRWACSDCFLKHTRDCQRESVETRTEGEK